MNGAFYRILVYIFPFSQLTVTISFGDIHDLHRYEYANSNRYGICREYQKYTNIKELPNT
jgi:hypothetical protein